MPYLYAVTSQYNLEHGLLKLGCTQYPISRLQTYMTGDAPDIGLDKYYADLWEIKATNHREMLQCESILHLYFDQFRQKRGNNWTEWFKVRLEDVQTFVKTLPFFIKSVSVDDIHEIHKKALDKEDEKEDSHKELKKPSEQLRELFFGTFLPNKTPRRIQSELWDTYDNILSSKEQYKGIVQWATGTGKSVAVMILIVLTYYRYRQKGQIYRGILVSNKNDIFDTLSRYLELLPLFGIKVIRGDHGKLASLTIPTNENVLITSTHQSLTGEESWNKLQNISHIHYDEVHRITGTQFLDGLEKKLSSVPFLTGTSATPKTSDTVQHEKIHRLFGNPLSILHRCDVDESIREEWIATPRFGVNIVSNSVERLKQIEAFVKVINDAFARKNVKGKIIAYLPEIKDVKEFIRYAKEFLPEEWILYNAIGDSSTKDDKEFVQSEIGIHNHILVACERYREGSDVKGLEMTAVMMGQTISAYILLQIAGRALRLDYPEKEGWCLIMRPSGSDETEEHVFESIVLDIMTFMGKSDVLSSHEIRSMVKKYFGEVSCNGKVYDTEETIKRIQSMYERQLFQKPKKERYEHLRKRNQDLSITSKHIYFESKNHLPFIQDPSTYFDEWNGWYHFLGVDTTIFPKTKYDFIEYCKDQNIISLSDYTLKCGSFEPSECYQDWTNWEDEMQLENDIW